jgi:hypothetical protein
MALHDFERASDWYERAYESHDYDFFVDAYWVDGAEYRRTARWKALTHRTLFREWQVEHDEIAADLNLHNGRTR